MSVKLIRHKGITFMSNSPVSDNSQNIISKVKYHSINNDDYIWCFGLSVCPPSIYQSFWGPGCQLPLNCSNKCFGSEISDFIKPKASLWFPRMPWQSLEQNKILSLADSVLINLGVDISNILHSHITVCMFIHSTYIGGKPTTQNKLTDNKVCEK